MLQILKGTQPKVLDTDFDSRNKLPIWITFQSILETRKNYALNAVVVRGDWPIVVATQLYLKEFHKSSAIDIEVVKKTKTKIDLNINNTNTVSTLPMTSNNGLSFEKEDLVIDNQLNALISAIADTDREKLNYNMEKSMAWSSEFLFDLITVGKEQIKFEKRFLVGIQLVPLIIGIIWLLLLILFFKTQQTLVYYKVDKRK